MDWCVRLSATHARYIMCAWCRHSVSRVGQRPGAASHALQTARQEALPGRPAHTRVDLEAAAAATPNLRGLQRGHPSGVPAGVS